MKYIYLLLICFFSLLVGCSSMDDTYKDFYKNGPIIYLTKIPGDEVLVQGGWYRTQFTLPHIRDMRVNKVFITWNNGKDSLRSNINSSGKTNILIDNLREGTFIFTCRLEDNEGNKSLNTDITGYTYGDSYQMYLNNRIITKKEVDANSLVLFFSNLIDSTAVASSFTWSNGTGDITKTFYYDKTNSITLENFNDIKFKMKTLYRPDPYVLDEIWSKEEEFTVN